MQLCNLSHTDHPACVVDEHMQTDRRMLRACRHTQTHVHAAGPPGTYCGALSTATVAIITIISTASLGWEAARHSREVLHGLGDRSSVLS